MQKINLRYLTDFLQIFYSLHLFNHKSLDNILYITGIVHLTGQICTANPSAVYKSQRSSSRYCRCDCRNRFPYFIRTGMIGKQNPFKAGCNGLLCHINTVVIVRFNDHGQLMQLCCACHAFQIVLIKGRIFRQKFHIVIAPAAADDFHKLCPCKVNTCCCNNVLLLQLFS